MRELGQRVYNVNDAGVVNLRLENFNCQSTTKLVDLGHKNGGNKT